MKIVFPICTKTQCLLFMFRLCVELVFGYCENTMFVKVWKQHRCVAFGLCRQFLCYSMCVLLFIFGHEPAVLLLVAQIKAESNF